VLLSIIANFPITLSLLELQSSVTLKLFKIIDDDLKSQPCFCVAVCGGTYYTSKGTLQSPNYPDFYPNNKDCTWIISVPTGQQIKLNVTEFNMEGYGKYCRYDYLEIRCVS
jgi:hypothetical protein